jgi:hypothetical protein
MQINKYNKPNIINKYNKYTIIKYIINKSI